MSTPTYTQVSSLIELPESGGIEAGDSWTLTKMYRGKYADAVAGVLPKGTAGSGALTGYMVQRSSVRAEKGGLGLLTIVWVAIADGGSGGPDLPADEFGLRPFDMSPNVEKNSAFPNITTQIYNYVKQASFLADAEGAQKAFDVLTANVGNTPWDEGIVLADFLRRGVTNYYRAAFEYFWVLYSWTEPTLNVGGYIEVPGGPLASAIAGLDLSCLRQADDLQYRGGNYVLTRAWKCAPDGHWDSVLYP